MALPQLCSASLTFLGAGIIFLLLMAVVLYAASFFSKKRKFLKPLAKISFIFAIAGVMLYLVTPFIIQHLLGVPNLQATGCDYESERPGNKPYCGYSICEQIYHEELENCTCILSD